MRRALELLVEWAVPDCAIRGQHRLTLIDSGTDKLCLDCCRRLGRLRW